MILRSLEAAGLASRLKAGLRIHGLDLSGARVLPVVRARAGDHEGFGEAPPLATFTGETADSILDTVRSAIAPALIGLEPREALDRLHATPGRHPAARAAVDIALHDLIGRLETRPVSELLGGALVRSLGVSKAIGLGELEGTVDLALGYVALGVKGIKLKLGRGPELDARVVSAVRRAVGEKVELSVDANGAYGRDDAVDFAGRVAGEGLAYFEQPVPRGDLGGMRAVRATGLPVLADESLFDVDDARTLLREEAADVFGIKLIKCGGLRPATEIIALAREHGIGCVLIDPLGSAVSASAGVHAASTVQLQPFRHGLGASLDVVVPGLAPLPLTDGSLAVPAAAGLGLGSPAALTALFALGAPA